MVAPSPDLYQQALERFDALATPVGALGRLRELGAWLAACQRRCPPDPLNKVRAVVLAGDHGVNAHGVSAYPSSVTPVMVRAVADGVAGISVLARQHDVPLRVLDISVDADPKGLPAAISRYKLAQGCPPINLHDAMTEEQCRHALSTGASIAAEEIASGAQLLIVGDLGIGNTTPAAALIAATVGLSARQVTGRGSGLDDAGLVRKTTVVQDALDRVGSVPALKRLAALGSPDFAVGVGIMLYAAGHGVPVLLDGVISAAEAVIAEDLRPGAARWFAGGHRSSEPAATCALTHLRLEPVVDLRMRLGEGSGAMAAVPLLRSAVDLCRDVAVLANLLP
ncbi:MAG: nicotinate-nucleotide--dimethylbenzimidazole phosphoribosyltransferase [Micrococcales bacterium]|nr:MAG: nicotinate-nucleotide--dimethylbenzimidazole phosphoribosyltransferase [Micrococcales bacterium]PIE28170.1 MAG: nicotinate-nucleotide--dimethylbenzimidazole phosphoribosyltransferase [Micrococcales bacterium]